MYFRSWCGPALLVQHVRATATIGGGLEAGISPFRLGFGVGAPPGGKGGRGGGGEAGVDTFGGGALSQPHRNLIDPVAAGGGLPFGYLDEQLAMLLSAPDQANFLA